MDGQVPVIHPDLYPEALGLLFQVRPVLVEGQRRHLGS